MEHFFHNIQGWFNYEDLYHKLAHELPEDFKFAEIGVWKGRSLAYFVVESRFKANKKGTIYAVDHWLDSEEYLSIVSSTGIGRDCYDPIINSGQTMYGHFLQNIDPIKDFLTIIKKTSVEAAKDIENNSLDAVFIDGSHKYEDVLADLEAWYPKIKFGGKFCGHDYDQNGVKSAVNGFAKDKQISVLPTSISCWIIN